MTRDLVAFRPPVFGVAPPHSKSNNTKTRLADSDARRILRTKISFSPFIYPSPPTNPLKNILDTSLQLLIYAQQDSSPR